MCRSSRAFDQFVQQGVGRRELVRGDGKNHVIIPREDSRILFLRLDMPDRGFEARWIDVGWLLALSKLCARLLASRSRTIASIARGFQIVKQAHGWLPPDAINYDRAPRIVLLNGANRFSPYGPRQPSQPAILRRDQLRIAHYRREIRQSCSAIG